MKIRIILLFIIFCSCIEKEYDFSNAIVHEAHYNHWGRGYYNLKLSYYFYIEDKLYKGEGNIEGLLRPTGNWKLCDVGDTIIIKYQKDNPQRNYFHSSKKRVKLWNKHGEYEIKNDSVVRVIIHKKK